MNDIKVNQFGASCPTCGKILTDRTYIDRKGGTYFFRTIFECESDNWALMTRLDDYNAIAPVSETDREQVMESALGQIKLDLVTAVIGNFIRDGVRNYPLDTVEKFTENGDTFYNKKMTSTASAFLHIFYRNLAAMYGQQSEREKQYLALQAAVDYLMRMEGDELSNSRDDKTDCQDAIQIFASLADFYRESARQGDADRVVFEAQVWLQKNRET